MRIFHVVTESEYGGVQSVVSHLSEAFCQDNETFILYGGSGVAWENLNKKVKKIRVAKQPKQVSWRDLFLLLRLFYYRIRYRPDIVHLHSSKMGALGRIAFNPKKIVYTIHGFDSVRVAYPKFLFIETALRNRAAKNIGVSQYDVDGLIEAGFPKDTVVIYNGLTDHTEGLAGNCSLNVKLHQKIVDIKAIYPKIVMCISRISKQKKFDLFLDIAKALPEYAFVWIGNKNQIEGLPGNVFCLGETNAAHTCLKYADLFILPSNYEGLPVSILEALSYSVPVVASAVGGIPEILDGKNGFCVTNEVSSFVEKIKYSLDESNHSSMADAARKSYLNNFTIDKMISGYKEIYDRVAKKS